MIPGRVELSLKLARAAGIPVKRIANELIRLRANQHAAAIRYEKGACLRGIIRVELADLHVATQSACQAEQAVTLPDCSRGVLEQDAKMIARVRQEKTHTSLMNAAVVVQQGLEVRAVKRQSPLRLAEQSECMPASIVGRFESLDRRCRPEREGCGLPLIRLIR